MYLTAPVYFKLFQTWGEAKRLLRLNVNIVLLPSLMKYILQVLISFLFFWIERVFYEGRYIKDLMHAKLKVNSFAPNLRRDQRHVTENSNTKDRYRRRERKGRKKSDIIYTLYFVIDRKGGRWGWHNLKFIKVTG